jgi:hypothetical protein
MTFIDLAKKIHLNIVILQEVKLFWLKGFAATTSTSFFSKEDINPDSFITGLLVAVFLK